MGKDDKVFCLICSLVSPSPPPLAASSLLKAKEFKTAVDKVLSKLALLNETDISEFIVKELAGTFDDAPPPFKYVTVNVVLEGARP